MADVGLSPRWVSLKLTLPRLTPDVKLMLALIAPAAIGQGAIQFNLLISTSLAARFLPEGSVSWLYYADRLNQLPLGLIGIAIGTAILPALSRQIAGADSKAASDTQNRAVELALFFAMPATVALIVSAIPIVHGIFEHGAFTPADTRGTAAVLMAFSAGVPAYVLIKVLTPDFTRAATPRPLCGRLMVNAGNLIGNSPHLAIAHSALGSQPPLPHGSMLHCYGLPCESATYCGDSRLKQKPGALCLRPASWAWRLFR